MTIHIGDIIMKEKQAVLVVDMLNDFVMAT